MERLEAKRVKGHTYYYYSKWARVDNRCRRVWQRYLGKLEDIVAAVQGGGPAPIAAEVFQWGLPQALWQEATRAQLVNLIDRHCPKRRQGLTTGQYLAIAAINRAISPRSKRSMWVWFSQTVLRRHMPSASEAALASQRFWDHMDSVTPEAAAAMWKDLLKGVIDREQIDLSSIGYDGTNFYTFLDTFNTRCNLAARGKNKQGRDNLRQVSYALFCTTDGQLPFFYDVYQGNRNDARQFSEVLQRFHRFFSDLSGREGVVPATTLIFDKGNNSAANFRLLDELKRVQSVSLQKRRFTQLTARVGDLEDSLGGVLDVRARCWSLLTSSWHEKNRSISLLHRCAPHRRGSEYAPWMVNLTSGRRPVHPPRNRCWRKLDRRSRNWSASALGKNGRFGNSRNGCWYSCSAWAVC